MTRPLPPATALALTVLLAGAGGWAVHVRAAEPRVAPAAGTEEAFGAGPYRRRVSGTGIERWTGARDAFRFARLPGPATAVEVALRHHANPVSLVVRGARVGLVPPGLTRARFDLPASIGTDFELQLHAQPRPGGAPGALVDEIVVRHGRSKRPHVAVLLLFVLPALAVAAGALRVGLAPSTALALAASGTLVQAAILEPCGLVRSPWAVTVAVVLAGGAALATALALVAGRRRPAVPPWAFSAGLVALVVQGLAATTPVMPVSDVQFHAHKLLQVAGGDWFPVSVTQHAQPFEFPYGVAFYALLVPFARGGIDPVVLVRWGAALASLAASAALFATVAPRSAERAALATAALQLLPLTFDMFSYGNLSNVFGQSLTVMFFWWWSGSAPGGPLVGAVLVALAALAHFSSAVVLGVLALTLGVVRWRAGTLDRTRVIAVVAGLGAAGLYYATFLPLIVQQLPRLREGGGTGRVSRGLLGEAWDEVRWLRIRWGLPAIVLGLLGRPRPRLGALDRDVAAFWAAGAVLAVVALVTPVEVRYVYALTAPLAIGMADGLAALAARGRNGVLLAAALGLAHAILGVSALLEAVLARYR